jgi:protein-S-isoprenylcysteine O-methyltransferase Ste14
MSMVRDAANGKGAKKWWYGIAVMAMFCIFFVGMDVYSNHAVTWSIWVVGAFLFFGVGFTLLNKFGRE